MIKKKLNQLKETVKEYPSEIAVIATTAAVVSAATVLIIVKRSQKDSWKKDGNLYLDIDEKALSELKDGKYFGIRFTGDNYDFALVNYPTQD